MDEKRFDSLTKALSRRTTRRGALGTAAIALGGLTSLAPLFGQSAQALGYYMWIEKISPDDYLFALSRQATDDAARNWPIKPPKTANGKNFICNVQGVKRLVPYCRASTVWNWLKYQLVRSNIKEVSSGSWNWVDGSPGCAVFVVDGAKHRTPVLNTARRGGSKPGGDIWGVRRGKAEFVTSYHPKAVDAMVSCMSDGSIKAYLTGRVPKSISDHGLCAAEETTCPAGSATACCVGTGSTCCAAGDDTECCGGDYPACCNVGITGYCCPGDSPVCCPPSPNVPDRPNGYCCPGGSTCTNTGCSSNALTAASTDSRSSSNGVKPERPALGERGS